MKNARAYGIAGSDAFRAGDDLAHNHFGLVVASCERADLRPLPHGVMVYGDESAPPRRTAAAENSARRSRR